ncbi:MAG: 50S ribosomal protein L25 [Patescibacteria group bacterium]
MLELEIKSRDPKESLEDLRMKDVMPAVLYGPKEDSTPIAISAKEFERIFKTAGETTIIKLKGVGDEKDALIHETQLHPVTGNLLHVDFYVLEKGKKVKIKVPLEFTGVAPAEKTGNIVVKAMYEIEIEVAPAELPHNLPVDISSLVNAGDHIVAKDVKLPQSAILLENPDEIVVSVKEFKEEKEEITPAPETVIIGEEKKTEAADSGEAAPAEKKDKKKE